MSGKACQHCEGATEWRLTWQTFANGTKHIRASCAKCGRFGFYVEQTDVNVAETDSNSQSDAANDEAEMFNGL